MVFGVIVEGAKSLVRPLLQPLFVPFLYWMLGSLGTILSVWTNGDRLQDENDFINPLKPSPYDFIIVGAGSAGCLLANRLSRSYSVLLIEAGGEPNPLQFIPGFSLFFPNYPDVDWQHRTVTQRLASLSSINGESSWSAGLGLGGTGNLNYMIHLRGHQRDFDNWATLLNDTSWSWSSLLPYFKLHEDYEILGDPLNHGYSGDLRIEAADLPPTALHYVNAGVELGYPNVDLNAPFTQGFDIVRYPIKRGVRQAPYKAFLEPARYRNSLQIMKFSQVNKILFRDGNIAYGVEYDRHGRTYVAQARREVIISAGTIGTSKLLLLSGIGPTDHLTEMNIPVVANLPVGQNLQDHLGVYLAPFFIREGMGFYFDRDLTIGELIKWFTLGRGRLSNSGCEAVGMISSLLAKARGEPDWPDIALYSYGFTNFRDGAENLARIFSLKLDDVRKYLQNDIGRDSLYMVVSGARPLSRGTIRLGGNSPYDKPIIDPNYLGDSGGVDLRVLLEGVKRAVYLMENTTAAGRTMGARFTNVRFPGCENLEFRSDEYWTCFIRRLSVTLHHPVGTAAIGSVVDTELRVIGVRGLRVIDASVQPVLVVANTQASVLMIAEKGADMIQKYWRGVETNRGKVGNKQGFLDGLFGKNKGNGGKVWWGVGGTGNNRQVVLEGNANARRNLTRYEGIFESRNNTGIRETQRNQQVELEMQQKLQKSLEDLKIVSELARENYNKQFREIERVREWGRTTNRPEVSTRGTRRPEVGTWVTRRPTTTSTRATTTTVGYRTSTTWEQQDKLNELEYYDDEDGGYASGDGEQYDDEDYEEEGNVGVPRPPAPPPPPKATRQVVSRAAVKIESFNREIGSGSNEQHNWSNRVKGVKNPNSLDYIEQYYKK